ncbi:hypothetical protein P7H22_26085 [Paenibacillus larvae]|nr:hypothetical protein [Paenibacillus larvae]MDT2243103.1 hypothetical protein [Paenibacillus larvae]
MTIQEEVDAWCVEPSTGSDPKDAEIPTAHITWLFPFVNRLKEGEVNAGVHQRLQAGIEI